jgi:hypothetical protein
MPGQIKRMIDEVIRQRSRGNPTLAITTRTKLILKGVHPDRHTATSEDDAAVIAVLRSVAAELQVQL